MNLYRYLLPILLFIGLAGSPALADTPYLLVLNKSDHTCWQINAETGKKIASYSTGRGPHEVAVSPDGKWGIVTNYGVQTAGHTLTLLNLEQREVAGTIDIAPYTRPHGIAWFQDSRRVIVTSETKQSVVIIDVHRQKRLRALPTDQQLSHMVALHPTDTLAYATNIGSGSVSVLNLKQDSASQPARIIKTGRGTEGVELIPGRNQLWVSDRASGTISIIDLDGNNLLDTLKSPGFPIRLAASADNQWIGATHAESSEVAVFDPDSRSEVKRLKLNFQAGGTDKERFIGNRFGDGAVPIGLTFSDDGKTLFVSASKADQVAVIDTDTWEVVRAISTGTEPDGISFFRP